MSGSVPSPLLLDEIGLPERVEARRLAIRASRRVPAEEPFFAGHFPGFPVVPGVFVVEALAACARRILASLAESAERGAPPDPPRLRAIPWVRFRRRVTPGDTLELRAVLVGEEGGRFRFRAEAWVGTHRAVEATLEFA